VKVSQVKVVERGCYNRLRDRYSLFVPFFMSVLLRCAILSFVIVSSADEVSGDAFVVLRMLEFVASEITEVLRFMLM